MSIKKRKFKFHAVMLVDDNAIDNFINQKMIESTDLCEHIYVHTSAKSALEFFTNFIKEDDANRQLLPEYIFLDINMPIMDGFQFIDEFKKICTSITIGSKIIILTSSINPADIEKAQKISAGIRYVNKPLTVETLKKL